MGNNGRRCSPQNSRLFRKASGARVPKASSYFGRGSRVGSLVRFSLYGFPIKQVSTYAFCRPQLYAPYRLSAEEVEECIKLAARGIILSAWLAAVARQEHLRFMEFMQFLKYG